MTETRPRALGAYVFAGGFSVGVQRHFDVACHLEPGNYGVATVKKNMPDMPVHYGHEKWPLERLAREPWDLIFTNPPCAAWSQAGKVVRGGDWRDDARVDCTRVCFGLLEALQPKIWVWESVPRALTAGREFVDELARRALDLDYSVTYLLHDARWCGAPQKRQRFMFVAHRIELDVDWPIEGTQTAADEVLRKMNNVGEADVTLPDALMRLLPLTTDKKSLRDVWDELNPDPVVSARGTRTGRPSFGYRRCGRGVPARTVAGYAIVHPTEDRLLTTKEEAALCGFPPDYEFVGSGVSSQIARGVCPPVGEWLARGAARSLAAGKPTSGKLEIVDLRESPGHREVVGQPGAVAEPEIPGTVAPRSRPGPPSTVIDGPDVAPEDGQGSGAYIRMLLGAGYRPAQIVGMVHRNFEGSRATTRDVAWNRAKMRREGVPTAQTKTEPQPEPTAPEATTEPPVAARQPTRRGGSDRPDRKFDQTALTEASHGYRVHRDYAAHFFRWGWVTDEWAGPDRDVLDVGCGRDYPLVKVMSGRYPGHQPRRYVGVDYNPLKDPPVRSWAEFHERFDFTTRYSELGQFDTVVNFEVIEHMQVDDGKRLLLGMRECLRPDGRLILSTPVFDGRAARNHIHEFQIPELQAAIEEAGMIVERRWGTFANYNAIKKVCTSEQLATLDALNEFYSTDVTACFLSPLYPDESRNNVWLCKRRD